MHTGTPNEAGSRPFGTVTLLLLRLLLRPKHDIAMFGFLQAQPPGSLCKALDVQVRVPGQCGDREGAYTCLDSAADSTSSAAGIYAEASSFSCKARRVHAVICQTNGSKADRQKRIQDG